MRKLLLLAAVLLCALPVRAQLWSGYIPAGTGVDWAGTTANWVPAGVPGGIPSGSWTQSGSTILASTYGNGSSDATSGIQTALNACGTNHYVLLGTGVFLISSGLSIPSNCVLRGMGANQTQLNNTGSSSTPISFGTGLSGTSTPWSGGNSTTFTGGSQYANTITVASASGISVGSLLMITQPDLSYMTQVGHGGNCDFCNSEDTNDHNSGEIVRVTNVAGTTLTIEPPLYIAYANPSYVFRFTNTATNNGLEDLKISQNNTHGNANVATINMIGNYASWVKGVESDFADNAHMFLQYSLHCEVRNSFFHDAYQHGPGSNDQQLNLAYKTSASLIINNIFWREHCSVMAERGPAGNVVAYNYAVNNYNTSPNAWQEPNMDSHGAHPMMNLYEGNIVSFMLWDDYWGSSSHHTLFRNYVMGTEQNVPPDDARGTLQPGSAIWEDNGENFGIDINDLNDYYNVVGDIIGSPHATSQSYVDSKVDPASGFGSKVCFRIGYDGSDNTTVSTNTVSPTTFIDGLYGCQSGTFTWASGAHSLPVSFFFSSKPSFWGSQPWPPIGPDVTGGNITGVGGYANSIPAMDCFNSVTSNGTTNVTTFNEATCYGGTLGPPVPAPSTTIFVGNVNVSGSPTVKGN
jgi:hypothetical protein